MLLVLVCLNEVGQMHFHLNFILMKTFYRMKFLLRVELFFLQMILLLLKNEESLIKINQSLNYDSNDVVVNKSYYYC
jgi:hypothetical protein